MDDNTKTDIYEDVRFEEIKEYVKHYISFSEKEKEIKQEKDQCKEPIAELMHTYSVNSIMIEDENENYTIKCGFESRVNKKVDHIKLLNLIGQHAYDEIVSQTPSTTLVIRKQKSKKNDNYDLTKNSPKNKNHNDIPTGIIS